MKLVYLILLMLAFTPVHAHSPDLSNIMIYEQNGKTILLLKGSLTAYEGEVDVHFRKNAYNTPEEFMQLVIRHFKNSCVVIVNNDTVQIVNPRVILGHETTVFAEIANLPDSISSLYISNRFFKEMPNNSGELILTLNGIAQRQYIFNNQNNHEVAFNNDHGKWVIDETPVAMTLHSGLLVWGVLILLGAVVSLIIKKRNNPGSAA